MHSGHGGGGGGGGFGGGHGGHAGGGFRGGHGGGGHHSASTASQPTAQPPAPAHHHGPGHANRHRPGTGTSSPLPHELVGQPTGRSPRRYALIVAGAGVLTVAAVISVIAVANSPTSPVPSSTAPSSPASRSAAARGGQLAYDQLRPGDCLQIPDISSSSRWPDVVTAVPCTRPHTGEVFFAGNLWSPSLAYPGNNAVIHRADARCGRAFTAYDGVPPDQSGYTYSDAIPDRASWSSGDRSVQCIAYDPAAVSVNFSIRGSGT